MAYATSSDIIARFDARTIGDLVSDDGVRVEVSALSGNANLTAALDDASGDVESALVMANRYTTTALDALTGNALATLKRITCEIAMAHLFNRRPGFRPEQHEQVDERARAHLERLRKGENVFNLEDQRDAGTPSVGGPTTLQFDRLGLIVDRTRHYYPRRQLPDNR